MARYFFALDISKIDKNRIHVLQQSIVPSLIKPTSPDNLHLTLVFLGQLSPEQLKPLLKGAQQIASKFQAQQAKLLRLNHLALFEQPKVLYAGLEKTPNWLAKLVLSLEYLSDNCKLSIDKRPYIPHVTLGRKIIALPNCTDIALNIEIASFSFYVSESTSQGVRYTALEKFSLVN